MDTRREIVNAVIDSITLGDSEHGSLSSYLTLKFSECSCQGFGGYALYVEPSDSPRAAQPRGIHTKNYAGMWIWRCLQIAGVDAWEKLPGKTIRAVIENGMIIGIGHIIKDDFFFPREEFKEQP